jgi:hypothetical protein
MTDCMKHQGEQFLQLEDLKVSCTCVLVSEKRII